MDDHLGRTRTAYDTVAVDYEKLLRGALDEMPWERAMFATFAELVRDKGSVVDVGCGPGRITGHLHELGLPVTGIDLSPRMVDVARATHPDIRFEVGAMPALDLPDGGLAGVVAWYSIIHTPPVSQPAIFAEFHRILRPGGQVLLAFQIGEDHRRHLEQGYGHEIDLDAHRLDPDRVVAQLATAGLPVHTRMVRERQENDNSAQAYLLGHKKPRI